MSEPAAGIVAYSAYIPQARLPLGLIHGGRAKEGGPEKAVAAFDEDAVTMAVAAGADCLHGVDRASVDGLYLATTTSPFREKQAAAFAAKALDLRADIATVDFGGSLRAAAGALVAAVNAVKAEPGKRILVIASDARLPAPRSPLEMNTGDAAAAFLVGAQGVVATLTGAYASAEEIYDVWRGEHDDYLRAWEDRFNVLHGYNEGVGAAVGEFFSRTETGAEDYARLALFGPDARSHAGLARRLGFAPERVQDALFGRVGSCGAALTPLLLASALEQSGAGDKVLAVFYGDGAEVLAFEMTGEAYAPRRGIDWHLERGRALRSYDSYLKSRHLNPTEHDPRGGDGVPATVHYRERDSDISFHAQRCTQCGTMHFPACRVCYGCYAKDSFEPVRMSDCTGRVMSYSFDYFFPSPEPPVIVGMCEVEGGARVYVQMADASTDLLRCDLPVEFVFRRIHEAGNRPNYFWKSRPLDEGATGGEAAA